MASHKASSTPSTSKVPTARRVTHINTFVGKGGAAKVAQGLCQAQQAAGDQAALLVGDSTDPAAYIHTFAKEMDPHRSLQALKEGLLDYGLQGSHALYKHPAIEHADLLHFHNLHVDYFNPFSLAALGRQHPSVWTLHDMQAFTGHCAHAMECTRWQQGCQDCPDLACFPPVRADNVRRLWQDKQHLYASTPLHLVCPSHWLAQHVRKSILREHALDIIPNSVNTQVFSPRGKLQARARLGIDAKALVVGSAAHAGPLHNAWKGGKFALDALDALRPLYPELLYLGRGNEHAESNPHIRLLPYTFDEEEMADFYAALDIMLYPTLADNCPLVVLEALACGVPIVAFDVGGVPELIENGQCGIIVPARDSVAFTKAVLALCKSPSARERMGHHARERAVQEYDIQTMVTRYEQVYNSAIAAWPALCTSLPRLQLKDIPAIIQTPQFFTLAAHTQSLKDADCATSKTLYPQELWNTKYSNRPVEIGGMDNCIIQKFREYIPCGQGDALEIGCCPGTYIGHLGTMGYTVHGLDLSPSVHDIPPVFTAQGLQCGEFLEQDFFDFCATSRKSYALVSSFGFVEHFENFEKVFFLHCRLVAQNGYLIVMFPNFLGDLQFALHTLLDKANMDRHVVAAMQLAPYVKMAQTLGFQVLFAGYFGGFSFWRENSGPVPDDPALQALHRSVEFLLHHQCILGESPLWSPFGGIIAQKIK